MFVPAAVILLMSVLALHLGGIALVWWRLRPLPPAPPTPRPAITGITLLRPVCGLENNLAETLGSGLALTGLPHEVIFCVADADDPVVPLVRHLIAAHPQVSARLLIGEDRISANPKLNNLAKGWSAARYDHIAMVDSNLLLPNDFLLQLRDAMGPGIGLVTSPPAGLRPQGFWGALECGFLNSYQARWQLAADQLGLGFAQGKVLFWPRALLEAAGGLAAMGRDMAEDVAATKITRAAGLRVKLVTHPFAQPIGSRGSRAVWQRQLRWAKVRRMGFPALFALEPLTGALVPLSIGVGLCAAAGLPVAALGGLAALWYGAEWLLARRAGWPAGPRDLAAWVLRDALIPALWIGALVSRSFEWHGTVMHAADVPGMARRTDLTQTSALQGMTDV
ncbi:glycosyltransferase [Phaeovulum sp. W22_SRMD_FR3]|uniref:glycosyltransferase n=1 Tax=Phaeovulum sp. W22_SRMD_FR3 TaxID=3240274 RepID=UPI003F9AE754